jgi:hypothetical protein
MTREECLTKRREHLELARKAKKAGNEAMEHWHWIFAANFGLLASNDPAKRERGVAMLKKNSDRFERDVLHPELGEKLRAEDTH